MFDIITYLGLIGVLLTAAFLLMQAYFLLKKEEKINTEICVSFAVSVTLLSLFLVLRYLSFVITLLAKIPPFSVDAYREISPWMIILSCIIAITALRFRRRFLAVFSYTLIMILFIVVFGLWRAKVLDFYYIDKQVVQLALGYTGQNIIQNAVTVVSAVVLSVLAFAFKIPKKVRESQANAKTQIIKLATAWLIIAGFCIPMFDMINPGLMACDPPDKLLWGGIGPVVYAPDGRHIYYWQTHGYDDSVNSGHIMAYRLYYATTDLKELKEIPKPISITGGFSSATGKYLLGQDRNLKIINSSTYKIVKSIDIAGASNYGWFRGDDEIWYHDDSSDSVIIRNIKSGITKKTDIRQSTGLIWSNDRRYALWLNNFEYNDPNTIAVYDYKSNESKEVVVAKDNQDAINCAILSGDDKTVYYVIKQAAENLLYLRASNIDNHEDKIIAPLRSLTK